MSKPMTKKEQENLEHQTLNEAAEKWFGSIPVVKEEDLPPEVQEAAKEAKRIHHWNYRVMRRYYPDQDGSYHDAIHEVHYDEIGEVVTWTVNPVTVVSEVEEDGNSKLNEMLLDMFKAWEKPTLDYETGKEINLDNPKYQVSDDEKYNRQMQTIETRKEAQLRHKKLVPNDDKPKELNEELIIEKILELSNTWPEEAQKEFDATKEEDLLLYHDTLGRYIRNTYKLWDYPWIPELDNRNVDMSRSHPDAISMDIIKKVHKRRNNG